MKPGIGIKKKKKLHKREEYSYPQKWLFTYVLLHQTYLYINNTKYGGKIIHDIKFWKPDWRHIEK